MGPVDKANPTREVDNQAQWPDKYHQKWIVGIFSKLRPWSDIVIASSNCPQEIVVFG